MAPAAFALVRWTPLLVGAEGTTLDSPAEQDYTRAILIFRFQ